MPESSRPADLPDWVDDPNDLTRIKEPDESEQALGFEFLDRPPFGWLNWAWNRFSLWARHFADNASRFFDPGEAYTASLPLQAAPMAPGVDDGGDTQPGFDDLAGGICFLAGDTTAQRGAVLSNNDPGLAVNLAGPRLSAMVATSRSIILTIKTAGTIGDPLDPANVFEVLRLTRDGSAQVGASYFVGAPGEQVRVGGVISDGTDVIVAANRTVRRYNHDTGTLVWTTVIPGVSGVVNGLAYSSGGTFIHAASSVPGAELVRINRSTGAIATTYDNNGALDHVAVGMGGRLYIAGPPSGHASGALVRCIAESTYYDHGGEGGVGDDYAGVGLSQGISWSRVDLLDAANPAPSGPALAADDRSLFLMTNLNLHRYNSAGVRTHIVALPGGTLDQNCKLIIDGDWVILITANKPQTPLAPPLVVSGIGDKVFFYDKRTMDLVWARPFNALGGDIYGADCDGHSLFLAKSNGTIDVVALGKGPRLWRRANAGPNGDSTFAWGKRQVMEPLRAPAD